MEMQYRERQALVATACAAALLGAAYLAKRELKRWRLLHSKLAQVKPLAAPSNGRGDNCWYTYHLTLMDHSPT